MNGVGRALARTRARSGTRSHGRAHRRSGCCGSMPRFNPTWKVTDPGKAVIVFLTKSPELD